MKFIFTFLFIVISYANLTSQVKVGIWEGFDLKVDHKSVDINIDSSIFGGQICFDEHDKIQNCEKSHNNFHGTLIGSIISEGVDVELYGVKFYTFNERDWYDMCPEDHLKRVEGICKMIESSMSYFDSVGCKYVNVSISTNIPDMKRYASRYYKDENGNYRIEDMTLNYIYDMEMAYRRAFSSNPNITFVVAAGNSSARADSINEIPSVISELDNVIVLSSYDDYSTTCDHCITYHNCRYNYNNQLLEGTSLCTAHWINAEITQQQK